MTSIYADTTNVLSGLKSPQVSLWAYGRFGDELPNSVMPNIDIGGHYSGDIAKLLNHAYS